jgi:hypothetical protein
LWCCLCSLDLAVAKGLSTQPRDTLMKLAEAAYRQL